MKHTSEALTCKVTFKGPGLGPSNALEMSWNLKAHIWKKRDKDFSKCDRNLQNFTWPYQ